MCGRHAKLFFHHNITWIIILAQIFGLMPIKGVTSKNYKNVIFVWRSKRVIFSIIVILGTSFTTLTACYRIFHKGYTLHLLSNFIFNANSTIAGLIFFNLARNWPKLIKQWSLVESSLDNWSGNRNLKRKFYIVIITIVVAAITEHGLSIIYECSQISDDEPDKFQAYFVGAYPHLFDFFEFSTPLAIFAVMMNFCNVFSWNFLDAFLMIISIGLTQKFKQITARVVNACNNKTPLKNHWMKIREDYNKISILCKTVNNEISTLIVVSFATNMFFITSQLYWSLNYRSSTIESFYFGFSFGLLLARTVAVIFFASSINDESKKSMSYLLTLNSDVYNSEIERFAFQIHCQPVALTGNDFFTITRSLLFGMAGSIVTYELFLIQSNDVIVE